VVAGLDGLVVGLGVGAVVGALITGPGKYLDLPWPVECAVAGGGAAAIALLGAASAHVARRILLLAGGALDAGLGRIAPPWRTSTRARRVLTLPGAILRSVPMPWLGALGALLLIANFGTEVGPFGLFMPEAALVPWILLGGLVAALGNAARRVATGTAASGARPGWRAGWRTTSRIRRAVASALVAVAVALTGYGGAVLVAPTSAAPPVAPSPALAGLAAATALADPGAPGPFAVRELSYGSGTDRHRPAFGADVDIRTGTVDASAVLKPLGWGADETREWFWGFGTSELPLNGLAWLPEGEGPFPLVLVVHGNHAMGDFSEPGYAYLGRHLASLGFITVSVDENFLNGSWARDWGGTEQLARAWLLLLHADLWRSWSQDPASPLHGLVDLDRIALMGHSRGGEAASVAASLAARAEAPASGVSPWPTGLRIRAVVAIAPSDGQFSGAPVVLDGIDFLTLHGGHDGDATSWMGIRQYARTVVRDAGFKAAIWSYRSNHGQFNTAWGRSDSGDLGGAVLDLGPLQDPADQEDLAKTAIGAFLEASLHDRAGYRDLFRRPMAGREWLPADDIYLVRSSDDAFVPLTNADGGRGVEGVTVTRDGFTTAVTSALPLRSLLPDQLTRATNLRWIAGSTPAAWRLDGIANVAAPPARALAIRLSLANGLDAGADPRPLDLLVELTTTDGVTVALPLSRWGALPPPLEVRLVKDGPLPAVSGMDAAREVPVERVLQTYELPLADFAGADGAFRPERVAALRLVVDRTAAGSLWIAEVGIVTP
jgi:dienelactone hydrolase